MKIPFSPPYVDDSVVNEVVDSLRSGWITTGPKVKALESEVMKLTGTKAALGVNSWTSGAIMMLRWLGLKADDEVIIPAYTYCATAMAVMWAGGKVVMVDSGQDFNISVDTIRKAITPKTKAIIPVDIGGYPCDYPAIMSLVKEPSICQMYTPENEVQSRLGRILVLSDSAHSLGAWINGRHTGSESDINVFSLESALGNIQDKVVKSIPRYCLRILRIGCVHIHVDTDIDVNESFFLFERGFLEVTASG